MSTILIAHNYTKDSFANMSYSLANHLSEIGYTVIFISHRPYFNEEVRLNFKNKNGKLIVYSWPTKNRPTNLIDLIWYVKIHLKHKPNFVIGHFVGANISLSVSKIFSFGNTKTISYYHTLTSFTLNESKNRLKIKILNFRKRIFYKLFCNLIICPSELAKQDIYKYFGVKHSIVIVNPMEDRFKNGKITGRNNKYISYLGRFNVSKGINALINAFNFYCDKNPKTELKLQLAGDDKLNNQLDGLIKYNKNIIFCGKLPYSKVDDYLKNSDFTIIPSLYDNLPTVGLESMMNGTALLVSDKTGLSDYIEDNVECLKFNPSQNDIYNIFDEVEKLSPNQIMVLGQNARRRYLGIFSMQNYFKSIIELLQ